MCVFLGTSKTQKFKLEDIISSLTENPRNAGRKAKITEINKKT